MRCFDALLGCRMGFLFGLFLVVFSLGVEVLYSCGGFLLYAIERKAWGVLPIVPRALDSWIDSSCL